MLETYPDQVIEEMPNRFQHAALLLFMLAAISGGLGGIGFASYQLLGGKTVRASYFAAYGIIGMVFGVLCAAYGVVLVDRPVTDIIGPALLAGIVGAATLGSMNWTARFVLKHLGVEIQVTMHRTKEKDAQ